MIAAVNKKTCLQGAFKFNVYRKNSFVKKNVNIHKMKECKRTLSTNNFFVEKINKWNLYYGPLVLAALKCYCGDNGHKMQTSFKTLVLKNAVIWRLHKPLDDVKFL